MGSPDDLLSLPKLIRSRWIRLHVVAHVHGLFLFTIVVSIQNLIQLNLVARGQPTADVVPASNLATKDRDPAKNPGMHGKTATQDVALVDERMSKKTRSRRRR
jgi:hypothetical protein